MEIPKLTHEQRIESFMKERISQDDVEITFTKKELAEFCLKEIDYAISMIESTDKKDVEEGLSE